MLRSFREMPGSDLDHFRDQQSTRRFPSAAAAISSRLPAISGLKRVPRRKAPTFSGRGYCPERKIDRRIAQTHRVLPVAYRRLYETTRFRDDFKQFSR
jgi:hypothetical protein